MLTVLVALGGLIGILAFFSSRDEADVSSPAVRGPGQAFPDQGRRHLAPGQRSPVRYASNPPTSGPHHSVPVRADRAPISNDQLLHAIELGDVVLLYGTPTPPPGLPAVAEDVAGGPFDPALAQSGQAVVLARRPGTRGIVAVAWRHILRVASPNAPSLREFADFWLGRGTRG